MRTPPLRMFPDRVDVTRRPTGARTPTGWTDSTQTEIVAAGAACSWQYGTFAGSLVNASTKQEVVGDITAVLVYFPQDWGLLAGDVVCLLDAAGNRVDGQKARVERARYQRAGSSLEIWCADCRMLQG